MQITDVQIENLHYLGKSNEAITLAGVIKVKFGVSLLRRAGLSVPSPQPIVLFVMSGFCVVCDVGFSNPTQWASGLSTTIPHAKEDLSKLFRIPNLKFAHL